ncbi:MAG TPA: aromatic ring-hydroxylating dioxygenase subunit alpha [Pirellulales bacterium]|nr:aromatic ring-hydroxylating dioxygenase subunit alpha [Pirellulales bacterium]
MFLHQGRLPHVLRPSCYTSQEHFDRELATIFRPAWHLVGTTADLRRPGDFITFELFGQPVQLRNIDGLFQAFSNVCVHRHCLLTSLAKGRSPKIRCQYHGWEYDHTGRTGHVPDPKNFVPFDREADRLETFRVERCGQLLFLSLEPAGPSLHQWLGQEFELLEACCDDRWRQTWAWSVELPCNWKVPIENSLEGYHIPAVHPETFKVAPTSERTTHVLEPHATRFSTYYVPWSWVESVLHTLEDGVMRALGARRREPYYEHRHLFPGLMVSAMDIATFCYAVIPISPTRCRAEIRLFGYRGQRASLLAGAVFALWAPLQRALTRRVIGEDMTIYAPVQNGMAASTHDGCLGAIEERVYAFQQYVHQRCYGPAHDGADHAAASTTHGLLDTNQGAARGPIPA